MVSFPCFKKSEYWCVHYCTLVRAPNPKLFVCVSDAALNQSDDGAFSGGSGAQNTGQKRKQWMDRHWRLKGEGNINQIWKRWKEIRKKVRIQHENQQAVLKCNRKRQCVKCVI